MKKVILKVILLPILIVLITSCKKETFDQAPQRVINNMSISSIMPCGDVDEHILWAGQNMNAGTVTVMNDDANVYVTYETTGGWMVKKTHLYVGACDSIPTNGGGNPQIGLFPYSVSHNPYVSSYTYSIPLSQLDDCYCIAAHAELVELDSLGNELQTQTGWAAGDPFGGNSWATKFEYCTQDCDDCTIEIGDYRTQTQGGWGASPNGNNPGVYMQANFDAAFPNGLVVGCSVDSIVLTSGQAVTDFLPQGGTPASLTQSYVDPTTQISVLAGQIVAATLSVGLDLNDPNFGASNTNLGDLIIGSGTFSGWTVFEVLEEANLAFGGCASNYSLSELNSVLTGINENFVDGTINNGFLICP